MTLNAQNALKFDKTNVLCEDKWIAYPANKDGLYMFGFIYIDSSAGLTFNYEGNFKIDKNEKFIKTEPLEKRTSRIMSRLQPNQTAIAEIPEEKFKELGIDKEPEWLKIYKTGENTIERLYHWGFMYNG
jgi:hypothetical protein